MKSTNLLGVSFAAILALFAMIAYSQPPKAVLNAKQLGLDDLDVSEIVEDVEDAVEDAEEVVEEAAEEIEEAVDDAEEEVAEDAEEAVEEAAEEAEEAVDDAEEAVEEAVEEAEEAEDDAEEAVEEAAEEAEEAVDDAEEAVEEAVEEAEEAEDDAEEAVEEAEDDAEDAVEEAEDEVEDAVEEAEGEVEDAVEEAEDEVEDAVEEAEDEVEDAVEEAGDEVEDAVEEAEDEVEDAVEEAEDEVEDVVEEAEDEVEDVVEETEDEVEDVVEEAEDEVEDVVEEAEDEVEDVVEEAEDEVEDVAEEAEDEVEEVVEEAEDEVEDVAEEAEDEVEDAVEEAEDEAEDVADPVEEAPAPKTMIDGLDPKTAKSVSEIGKLEEVRRKILDQHGRDCLQKGYDALEIGSWQIAIENFEAALRFLPDKETTHELRNEASDGIGEAWYRKALGQFDMGMTEEALKSCREARSYLHPKAEELMHTIRDYIANPPKPEPPPRVPRPIDPQYKELRKDIATRLRIAREFYTTGEYSDCRREVELCLKEHPWCPEALRLLRKLEGAEFRYARNERDITREGMIGKVMEAWSPRNYGVEYTSGDSVVATTEESQAGRVGAQITAEMRLVEKMRRITIPEIDLKDAPIGSVIEFLGDSSREFDEADTPEEDRGINFVLDIGQTGGVAEAAPVEDDPWGAGIEEAGNEGAGASGVPLLTIRMRYVSLLSTLDMIMDMAGLKYRVQGNVVMIQPKNKADGELVHRMYNVLPSIGERLTQIGSAREGGGGSDDPFGITAGKVEATSDWKEFFGKLGVPWPDGSTVEYMPSIGKLVVKNTATNLSTLEQVLGALNVTPYQVEIEVRFVEVAQTDLNSLGLEWILNDDWEMLQNREDSGMPMAARRRILWNKGSINSGFNYLSSNGRAEIQDGNAVADGIAKFTSILTNPELSLVLHALSNRSNADLLSAPKVVAKNGSQATIKTVVEYIYPTEYEVNMLESSNNNSDTTTYTGAVVEPQSFVTREVGVILQVTPRVSADGSMIDLDLTPSVVSDPTWKNYGSTYPVFNEDGTESYVQLMMEQPFFPVRSLATSVSIYNGSTVVMGGMIREERFTEEDKIPILGDIPLLGRLFRYKYEQSEKKNLLVFVTGRLVDPAGRVVKGSGEPLLEGGITQ